MIFFFFHLLCFRRMNNTFRIRLSQKYPTQLVTRDVGFLYFTNQTLQTTNAEQSVREEIEKFCLRWNDFESNISTAFKEVREDKDFFDVTIACGDEQIQAHKVILSACSPFFRTVLRNNRHEHPLLYLKGVAKWVWHKRI